MNFFRRSQNKSAKEPSQNDSLNSASAEVQDNANASSNEASVTIGQETDTPDGFGHAGSKAQTNSKPAISPNDPVFQQMVREEAKRLRVNEQLLSAPHLARIEDALRLNETKMENIEENLNRTRKQQERVRRYQELSLELYEQKNHLYDVNKQLAANIKEREDLDRFEEFENVQGQFQRLSMLESLRHEQKQRLSELTRDLDATNKILDDESKRLQQQQDEMQDAARRLVSGLDAVTEAQQIEGRSSYMSILERRISERLTSQTSIQTALEKEMEEHRRNMENLNAKMETLRTRKQSLAPHHRMAIHGELVLERLTHLATLETELEKAEQQEKISLRKQSDENDMLERVYTDYLQIEQDRKALNDELHVHRENNHGLDSYRLQERAMQLKLRREMLLSAQSLWVRIANGYIMIEEIMQRINSLRLKQENLTNNVNNLSKELSVLRRTCKEKEYTFTLSKSQNVIQLRSDLKEGTSCTVCGATHHPYHSDTMLEQNKLIGELKMEYEAMATEQRAKEQTLRELELEASAVTAAKEEAENTLITLRALQNGYIQDWQMFAHLDRTFQTCDSSVNAPARTAMLRQLIENIGTEVDQAQKELDTFNFHQKRINELTEQIAIKEQKKNELITRLNEVNTGCQVMAGHLDRVQTHKQTVRDNYSRLYEDVDKMITIPDWKNIWNRSHEALLMRIQEIVKEWNELTMQLASIDNERALKELKLTYLQQTHQTLLTLISQLVDDRQECHDRIDEDRQNLEKLIGKESSKQRLQMLINDYKNARTLLDEQREKTHQCELRKSKNAGRQTENVEAGNLTDERAMNERQGVDLWMRKYNANHPPVQYNELEEMFANDRNWNDIRARLRSVQMESLLTQARVDKLGSQLVSLQAEGTLNGTDTDLIQNQLAGQIETLEGRRRETMMQIATLTQQLNAHKKAEISIKEEKMKEK